MPTAWLCQSNYSFLQGASFPTELLQAALQHGWDHIALCDFDGVYGLVQGFLAAEKVTLPRGVFYGAQVGLALKLEKQFKTEFFTGPVFLQNRLAFIPVSKTGYTDLCRLINFVHKEKQATPLQLEGSPWPKSCIAILPARGVSQLFSPRDPMYEEWLKEIRILNDALDDFYLALTPPTSPLEKNAYSNHLQASKDLNIPVVATEDVFFHNKDRKQTHDLLTAIRMNRHIDKIPWAQFQNAERTFHNKESFVKFFEKDLCHKVALENNSALERRINFCLSELTYQYPSEFLPSGYNAFAFLKELSWAGLRRRYNGMEPEKAVKQLNKELTIVEALEFADYFLTVWDIVNFARRKNILCQGRGSAANSSICFFLGIVDVDPLKYDMMFERFVSQERGEPPDIDVDFEHERREEVIQYIYNRYGRARAAMVANVISFKRKGALRFAAKSLGLEQTKITRVLEVLSDRSLLSLPFEEILQEGIINYEDKYKEKIDIAPYVIERWAKLGQSIRGFPRHLGIHSGGFVISNEPLDAITAQEPATKEKRSVIQWNKDDLEALGLFKIDILALGMLTAVRKAISYLQDNKVTIDNYGTLVALDRIPSNCPLTYKMIGEAKTTGVFQIESRAQMSILPVLKPKKFYDLVVQVGIVRPGPIVSGAVRSYVKRRTGEEPVIFPHEKLRPILERTYGIPIFQEQVMSIAMAVGDFTAGEADELRRNMGVWQLKGNLNKFKDKLYVGMRKNGIEEHFIQQIFDQITGFSEYGFPESHATCFAFLTYTSCYLKAHFPNYFLCGLLNSQPLGFYSVHSLLQEARHNGVQVLEPCVLNSKWDSYLTTDGSVRLGFRVISGLSKDHVDKFVADRALESGCIDFAVLTGCLRCLTIQERTILVMADAFKVFDANRRNILWKILFETYNLVDEQSQTTFEKKFGLWEAWDDAKDDFNHMHTTLGEHPVSLIKKLCWPFKIRQAGVMTSKLLMEVEPEQCVTVCGLIVVRQSPPTAKGMLFVTIEDECGTINLVITPQVFRRHRRLILHQNFGCFLGKKEARGVNTVMVNCVLEPQARRFPTEKPLGRNFR